MKTRLLLIRHGETEWTRMKRYCGSNDVPLNARGRRQASLLGKALKGVRIDTAYCSDLRRTRETARLALGKLKTIRHPGLREMDFGIFEGKTHARLLKDFPELYGPWLKDFGGVTPPGAESFRGFRKRVAGAFRQIVRASRGKTCAVVSHGGVMMVILSSLAGKGELWKLLPSLASLSVVEIEEGRMKLISFNDTSHLSGRKRGAHG